MFGISYVQYLLIIFYIFLFKTTLLSRYFCCGETVTSERKHNQHAPRTGDLFSAGSALLLHCYVVSCVIR